MISREEATAELKELGARMKELEAIINKPIVKPLFPRSWEEGARFFVQGDGIVVTITDNLSPNITANYAKRGRTFRTMEDAGAFSINERAKQYCLERINEVNEGDNGFKCDSNNFFINYDHLDHKLQLGNDPYYQSSEASEYIRTLETANQLINDPEFVENWKIFKGGEQC